MLFSKYFDTKNSCDGHCPPWLGYIYLYLGATSLCAGVPVLCCFLSVYIYDVVTPLWLLETKNYLLLSHFY